MARRSDDPVRLADRLHRRARGGSGDRAPIGRHRSRARPSRRRVRGAPRRRRAQGIRGAARALANGLPLRRRAQVLLRLLVPDELVEQDPRVRRPARYARVPRRPRRHLPAVPPRGLLRARRAPADVGDRWGAARPDVLAADRREAAGVARAARRLDAAAGRRCRARGDDGPGADHALGRHHAARPRMGPESGGRLGAERNGGLAGCGRRPGPRRQDGAGDRRRPRGRDSRLQHHLSRLGARSSRRSRPRSPTSAASCRTQRSSAREYGLPAVVGTGHATAQITTGQRIRVDGTAGTVTILE